MDLNTILFRRPTKRWPNHQLNSIYTEESLEFIYIHQQHDLSRYSKKNSKKDSICFFLHYYKAGEIKQAVELLHDLRFILSRCKEWRRRTSCFTNWYELKLLQLFLNHILFDFFLKHIIRTSVSYIWGKVVLYKKFYICSRRENPICWLKEVLA